ncbi:BON domain-containing protein [Bdellovibrio sp. ZAP7]|uniref:BON domain-containing protein n=1 Tax=Bdellovibrio sp. ZAP7 TaxID=2231053 RepID=UPI001157A857|nr:BON domain-containing protein [Bdellovibrio sp. ZAP7]
MKRFLIFAALFLILSAQANAIPEGSVQEQEESAAETLEISDAIRALLKNDSTLSVGAQNVGIFEKHNCIILKGSVKSAEEQAKIGKIAEEASPGMKIINDTKVR